MPLLALLTFLFPLLDLSSFITLLRNLSLFRRLMSTFLSSRILLLFASAMLIADCVAFMVGPIVVALLRGFPVMLIVHLKDITLG